MIMTTTATIHTQHEGSTPPLPPLPATPGELGLDAERFPAWRPGQPEIILRLAQWFIDDARPNVLMLQAPTGTGKSLIAAGLVAYLHRYGLLHGPGQSRAIVSTITRNLQTQYMSETLQNAMVLTQHDLDSWGPDEMEPEEKRQSIMSVASAWGRQGHSCLILPVKADEAPCTAGFRCPERHQCSYYVERDKAQEADLAVLNTAMYLTGINWVTKARELRPRGIVDEENLFANAALAIHDEGHQLEQAVRSLVEVRLYPSWFILAGLEPPPTTKDYDTWLSYLERHMDAIDSLARSAEQQAKRFAQMIPPKSIDDDQVLGRAASVARAFRTLYFTLIPSKPLISFEEPTPRNGGRHVLFRPVWGAAFADHMLFRHAHKHLLMSATLPHPKYTAQTLGLEDDQWEYIALPNPFAVGRRRIEYRPVLKMNARTTQTDLLRMIEAMDLVIDRHPEHKGIIHAVSYDRMSFIQQHSRHAWRMLTHGRARGDRERAIDIHVSSKDPTIIVSPAVGVGEDFGRGDNCRFQVFIKYPIPYLGDPVTRARMEERPDSLWIEADIAFVQAVGRGTRSELDWCTNYLLDKGAAYRLNKLPADIQQALVRI